MVTHALPAPMSKVYARKWGDIRRNRGIPSFRGDGMLGRIVWRERPTELERVEVEGLPILQGGFPKSGWFYRARLGRYLKKLRRQGVRRMLVPEEFSGWEVAKKQGISPVNSISFLRKFSGDFLVFALKKRGYDPGKCAVALRGTRVGRDMIEAADRLVFQVRDICISAPHGGESLQNLLRQEWGLAVHPDGERVEGVIRFDSGGGAEGAVVLSLFGSHPQLGGVVVDPLRFSQFSEEERLQLLTVLWESGKIGREKLEFYLT